LSGDVLSRLDLLYRIGEGEGANRPGLSQAEEEAHRLAGEWLVEAGAEVTRDGVGNTFGRLQGDDPVAPEVWVGSHLDSVPNGGRFDGALGVVAAIAALERLHGHRFSRSIAAVALRDEEGWRFGRGFFGSRAVCGLVGESDLALRDRAGVTMAEALASLGFSAPEPGVPTVAAPGLFVEPHVEQGPVLAEADAPLGVVRTIVGMVALRVEFTGSGGHAGTVPLARRSDALVAAARYITSLRDEMKSLPDAVVTVGECTVVGAASNVIPSRVAVTVDARAPVGPVLARVVEAAERLAQEAAAGESATVAVERLYEQEPIELDPGVQDVLGRACGAVGFPPPVLVSGAGHDAGVLAVAGTAAGILFVRSGGGGASHSPAETTDARAIDLAVEALVVALPELAEADNPTPDSPAA
jgi:allantoate deiminase